MDARLRQDIDHLFSVFHNNTLQDLHKLLPLVPEAIRYQAELEKGLNEFRAAIISRLEQEIMR